MNTFNRDNQIIVPVELRLQDYLEIRLAELHASNTQKSHLFYTREKRDRETSRDVGKGNASGLIERDEIFAYASRSAPTYWK